LSLYTAPFHARIIYGASCILIKGAARDRKIVKIEYNITDTRFVMSRRGAEEAAGGRRLICEQRESLRMGRRIIT
jgi:hypothetical protein